jgi:UDP-N-acetyl-2-amino-2-deoxyglucuronate dehydrogenase
MSSKIKFAVIGYGHIGKRHAEMVRNNPNAKLMAVCDIKPAEEVGADAITEQFFTSYEDLIAANLDVDVINICVPNGLHTNYSLKALDQHKHVVVEKPIALTRHDAEKMVYKSLEMSRHVFCVMQNRYSPPSEWLKKIVSEKIIGETLMVQLNCYWNRDNRYYKKDNWHGTADLDGGTLFTQFSHFIDIMYWLFGDIINIQGKFKDFTHKDLTTFEDSGFVNFDFINGGMGSLNYSTAINEKNFESSITIIGTKGTVKVAGQYMNEVEYCEIENYEMPELRPSNPPNDYGLYKGSAQNHNYVIENVIDKLQNKGSITTNVLEGMKIVDIIERIYKVRDEQGY